MSGIKLVDISRLEIDPEAVRMFSYCDAHSQRIMPLKLFNYEGRCVVKVAVPDDIDSEDLEHKLARIRDRKNILLMPVYVSQKQIDCLLEKYAKQFSW